MPPASKVCSRRARSPAKHTAYDVDVVTMAIANSMEEPLSKEYRGLFRRRAAGM